MEASPSDLLFSYLSQPVAKTLCFLYKDIEAFITPPQIVEVDSSDNADTVILALSDVSSFLATPSQRKLLFYCVYWLRLGTTNRKDIQEQISSEIKRLEVELQRAEDQERFLAANEAVQQQSVYYQRH